MNEKRVNKPWLRYFVYFSPLVFPAYFFRFTLFNIPFTALEVFCYVLFGLWVLSLGQSRTIHLKKPLPGYWVAGALLFLGASLGVLMAPAFINLPDGSNLDAQRVALGVWKGWIVAPLLYGWVVSQSLNTKEHVEKFLRFFVVSAAVVSLLCYGYALWGNGITYDLRLSGFYESANQLSLYLVPAILLNVMWMFERKGVQRWMRYVDSATLAVLLHALFFTQSYAAVLSIFGSLVLYALYRIVQKGRAAKKAWWGMGILLVILLSLAISQLNSPKFKQFLDFENRSSTTVRFEIYQTAWQLIKENPLWGIGPGLFQANYQQVAPQILERAPMEWNIPHPHNIFLAFWLNAGLLGFLALLLVHALVHRRFTVPLVAFWGIILHGFFDTPFWKNDLAMVFWLVAISIALLQSYESHSPKNTAVKTRSRSGGKRAPSTRRKRANA